MGSHPIPSNLRTEIDELRVWLCAPEKLPSIAIAAAARSLVSLAFREADDIEQFETAVNYLIEGATDERDGRRLAEVGRIARNMADMERDKRRAATACACHLMERAAVSACRTRV